MPSLNASLRQIPVSSNSVTERSSSPRLEHFNDSGHKSVAGCDSCSFSPDVDLAVEPQSSCEHGQKITPGVTMVIRSALTDAH